jgi:hypothetical protein
MKKIDLRKIHDRVLGGKSRLAMSRTRLGVLLLGLIVLWGMTWLGLSTRIAVEGQRVRELDDQVDMVLRQNAQLEYDIAVLTQPDRIAKRATALGLRPASSTQIVYLDIKYPPRAAFSGTAPLIELPVQFDLGLVWHNALALLGLNINSTAEASP